MDVDRLVRDRILVLLRDGDLVREPKVRMTLDDAWDAWADNLLVVRRSRPVIGRIVSMGLHADARKTGTIAIVVEWITGERESDVDFADLELCEDAPD